MRLIDATRIEQYILNSCSDNEEINAIYAEIINAPTVDAVEVVRCKDCAYCSENGGEDCPIEKHHPIQMNGFCHFGERRSE